MIYYDSPVNLAQGCKYQRSACKSEDEDGYDECGEGCGRSVKVLHHQVDSWGQYGRYERPIRVLVLRSASLYDAHLHYKTDCGYSDNVDPLYVRWPIHWILGILILWLFPPDSEGLVVLGICNSTLIFVRGCRRCW